MTATTLLLVRHAEVEPRYQRVFGGTIDMDLSERGRRQAEVLAEYLSRQPPDAVYASPLKRVRQTLVPLRVNGHPEPVVLDDLREVDFGDWTGLVWEEVEKRFGISPFDWLSELHNGTIPNAESGQALCKRIEPHLKEIIRRHQGKRVAVFCHGGVIRAALSILLELPLLKMAAFEVAYASVTWLEVHSQGAEVQLLNFAPWRDSPD